MGRHAVAVVEKKKSINQSELNRLVQQIHDLREALRPFAVFSDSLPPIIEGKPRITDSGPMLASSPMEGEGLVLTFAHLRDAKVLLDRLEAEDVERHVAAAETEMGMVECSNPDCPKRFLPAVSGLQYCSILCADEAAYWAALETVDFSKCCGGNDRMSLNHCTDCEHYKEPP